MIHVREEQPGDIAAVRAVNEAAFASRQEADIVDALRTRGGVLLSLVATLDDRVTGHILYSPVEIGGVAGAGLGPMAVLPEHQRTGIGTRLVEAGNRRLAEDGCPFIVVLGHPGYYPRFGFEPASRYGITCAWDVPDDVFMVLMLAQGDRVRLSGLARYRPEFIALG